MKKVIYIISATLLAITGLTSCEKDLMDFEGESSLYFDARWYSTNVSESLWPHRHHTPVEFGNTMDNDLEVVIPVRTSGAAVNYDREYIVKVNADSTTATVGQEYDALPEKFVIKAGELTDTIKFMAHRTTAIDDDTLKLQLVLVANSNFTTNFKHYQEESSYFQFVDVGGSQAAVEFDTNRDATVHNVFIFDTMVQPKGWWAGLQGAFSAKKLRLMAEICGCDISAFATQGTMPTSRASSYAEKLGRYLIEQAKLGPDHVVLEKDGTMMWVPLCSTGEGSFHWTAGTTPEEFYKLK